MEEKIQEIIERALECKVLIEDENREFVSIENFKQLPMNGDIIESNHCKKYEVVRREFDISDHYSWEHNDYYCKIVVKCITKEED